MQNTHASVRTPKLTQPPSRSSLSCQVVSADIAIYALRFDGTLRII